MVMVGPGQLELREAIRHRPWQVNEGVRNPSAQIASVNVKLDFGPPIATFQIVFRAIASLTPSFPRPHGPQFSDIVEEARLSARALLDYGDSLFNPTVRLGVTGLSRAGKTVFITALIHGLTRGGRFPVFEPFATGRIARARLEPQPDDAVPRFDYENHVRTLIEERRWPNSTVDISELRLVIDYQRQNGADRTLTLDIVDYPGEWLLDLPLLNKSYEQWSAESLALSREPPRAKLAAPWHAHLATLTPRAARTSRRR